RAWATDVIGEINQWLSTRSLVVRSAGGEWGVAAQDEANTLFPDVLLFGDMKRAAVLQGWELKMPDTPITDEAFIENARKKALRLGLNSFLLWNATEAALYDCDETRCHIVKTWHCNSLRSREDVRERAGEWRSMLHEILEGVCAYLNGVDSTRQKPLPEKLAEVVSAVLTQTVGMVADAAAAKYKQSRQWRARVDSWWMETRAAHCGDKVDLKPSERFQMLASELLLHWIHRFLFAHYLKRFAQEAIGVERLTGTSSLQDAEQFFAALSSKRDYAQVFRTRPGAEIIPKAAWQTLTTFNGFLNTIHLPTIDQDLLQESLQSVTRASQRKLAGQFCTPIPLARLLVSLAVDDLEKPVLDPCCGTGTIARAVLDKKIETGVSPMQAIRTTFASDLHVMPLQFATVSLALGDTPFETIRTFQHDALKLKTGMPIQFVDARTGNAFTENLAEIPCIVMNPPFVRFEDWFDVPAVQKLNKKIKESTGVEIDPKADYFVPVVLSASQMLPPGGRLGAIFPNSWLGTAWAEKFRKQLNELFLIETIAVSGKGRWFKDAKIVTTLVILQKRKPNESKQDSDETEFIVTNEEIDAWKPALASQMLACNPNATCHSLTRTKLNSARMRELEQYGLGWNAFFADLSWWSHLEKALVPVKDHFTIARGERRGWDALFYPPERSGIEPEYLQPVLKTSASVKRLDAKPDAHAFCCSAPIDELQNLGHHGAMAWIKRFEQAVNEKGRPLSTVLKQPGKLWYEMRPDAVADLAISINPGNRLFFIRLTPRAFTNQRLTRLVANATTDVDLCHALLCSLTGCLYLEAIGFGRGLGALDLSASRLRNNLWMLDPARIAPSDRTRILTAFSTLKNRDVMDFEDEVMRTDRQTFETTVLDAFGLNDWKGQIQKTALDLHRIRNAANLHSREKET
ncbi:MAG: N-6 DNA methylase, partial [Kiritimatiellia bacterium]